MSRTPLNTTIFVAACVVWSVDACSSEADQVASASGGTASAGGGRPGTSGNGGSLTSGGANGEAGSTSGGAGTGGANGAGGTAGEGGLDPIGVGGAACLPDELAALVAPCPLPAECTHSTTDSGHLNVCYVNGVKTRLVPQQATSTTTVRAADGSTCYVLDATLVAGSGPSRYDYVWMNAGLETIATGSLRDAEGEVLLLEVSGIRYRINLGSEDCRDVSALPLDTGRCKQGSCSF